MVATNGSALSCAQAAARSAVEAQAWRLSAGPEPAASQVPAAPSGAPITAPRLKATTR